MLGAVYRKDSEILAIEICENVDYSEFVNECRCKINVLYMVADFMGDCDVNFSVEICEV